MSSRTSPQDGDRGAHPADGYLELLGGCVVPLTRSYAVVYLARSDCYLVGASFRSDWRG